MSVSRLQDFNYLASEPSSHAILPGSNRLFILILFGSHGSNASGRSSVLYGDQGTPLALLAEADAADRDVFCQAWYLTESQISATTGDAITYLGGVANDRASVTLTLQDAMQSSPSSAQLMSVFSSSGSVSLSRSSESLTFAFAIHDFTGAGLVTANPAREFAKTITGGSIAYGGKSDTLNTSSTTWSHASDRDNALVVFNIASAPPSGPSITNIDTDNEVTPGQTAVINVTEGGDTFTTATLGGSACTFTGTATATTRPVIIPTDLPYGTHELLVDGTISLAGVTLSPTADKQVLTVSGVDLSSNSLFYNSSPAVANGDQWELPTLTDQGKAIVADASGTVTVTGAGQQVQTFTHRVYDMDVGAWSNMPTVTITPQAGEPDTTKPNIEIIGSSTVFVDIGDTFTDQGALVTDNVDANTTIYSNVTVTTASANTFTLPYDYTDSAGNVADTAYRTVVVRDPDEVTANKSILRSIWTPII